MANYLELAKHYNLNLTEVSILVKLDKKYPKTITNDQLSDNEEWTGGYLRKRKHD
ncbi:hypothetical protein [Virgibacillus sediminis]|uniref:Uncharacterized protein n=1 Tax=Virgibacillus sediminis TaxID=202260 RepID=A0ABV7A1Q4_9BACI